MSLMGLSFVVFCLAMGLWYFSDRVLWAFACLCVFMVFGSMVMIGFCLVVCLWYFSGGALWVFV